MRGGKLSIVRQTVGIMKMAADHAELLGTLVHGLGKGDNVARMIARQCHGGIIGTSHENATQEIEAPVATPGYEACASWLNAQIPRLANYLNFKVASLYDEQGRQKFLDARDLATQRGLPGKQNLSGFAVRDQATFSGNRGDSNG